MNSIPHRGLIIAAVMLATIIEVLDMTIVNVSLPHMMGSLGANTQEITWVLTAYIVSAAICMPLTGFLSKRFGQKRLLLVSIAGFLVSSVLCGASTDLTEMLVFRTFQGIFGASLVPLSQTILQSVFPKEEQSKAMAIWGVGVMIAPVLGPTLGGYITQTMNWRWIFYINIPVCIFTFFLVFRYLNETVREKVPVDLVGLILMTLGIGSLQIFLDQGNSNNWFQSSFITYLAILAVCALTIFIIRGYNKKDNIVNLRLFADKNFALSTIMLALFVACMFGILALLPIMLEELMNYPAMTTGLVMGPQGLTSALGMATSVALLKRVDPRRIMFVGLLLEISGSYLMTRWGASFEMRNVITSMMLMGFGMGLFFVPITTLAYYTMAKSDIAEGSGLFSFSRNLGSSIGISILSTIFTRQSQVNWNQLSGHLRADNPAVQQWLSAHHLTLNDPLAMQLLGQTLSQQANLIAFIDSFWVVNIAFISLLALVFFFKRVDLSKAEGLGFIE